MSSREFQVEMLWDCPIGHKRQLGRNTECAACGRPKTEAEEYYMPDEGAYAPEVTDAEMLADAKAGPNWSCKFCGCHERRNDNECANCGVPQKDGDSEVWERDQKERFDAINPPPDPDPAPTSEYSLPVRPRRQWRRAAKYLGGAVGALTLVGALFWTCSPHPENVRVDDVYWERIVRLQKQVVARESGWSPSGDAFNVSNDGPRLHHMDHRVVGHHTEYYNERVTCGQDCTPIPRVCRDIPRNCTTTPRSCRKSNCTSNKNGYATCSETCTGGDRVCTGGGQSCTGGGQSCSTRYCNERRSKVVDDYQDFPIFAPYYSWDAWRWMPSRNLPTVGHDTEPKWATYSLNDREQEAGRNESYKVTFVNSDGKKREWTPKDEDDFRRFSHRNWLLDVDRLGVIHSVTPR